MEKTFRYIVFLILCFPILSFSQTFNLKEGKKYQKLNFQLVNNLIIIPVEVNGSMLSFILDSGVSTPILFNISDQDSIQINNVHEVTIRGLGEGDSMKALSSRGNFFKIENIESLNQDLYVVMDKSLNFSPSLGVPIHGIIGYDLFRDFIIDVNYSKRVMKLYRPKTYVHKKSKRYRAVPLTILKKKAYVKGTVSMSKVENIQVNLLVDTGSSDALWLFENEEKGIAIPDKNYEDFLGKGLSGNIYGKRTKVNNLSLGGFFLKDAKAAFPDKESYANLKSLINRNGSIGGEVLKRFNIVFDYAHNKITLKRNKNFNTPFRYNMSGIDLQHSGVRYMAEQITEANRVVSVGNREENHFGNVQILFENTTRLSLVPEIIVSGIRAGSPSDLAGLREGDLILAVNGKRVYKYKLQEILTLLNEKEGKKIRVLIERSESDLLFSYVLKKVFK
ncbi:MAG: aspartyl protease family protein [Cellulophaga sp.]